MTREECENKLLEKCKEMSNILKEYDPEANYLSVSIYPKDGYIAMNNDYWDGIHTKISVFTMCEDTFHV